MEEKDTFVINVQFGGFKFPLRVPRKDEEIYRNAEKILKKRLDEYQQKYRQRPTEEILILVAYQLAVSISRREFNEDVVPLAEKIKSLDEELKQLLTKD